ncbi:MAG: CHAT domain-containing protein [Okeania sp. SIO2D1]|nr:CHAT domain-containing protein [Okeania sp. SIO2D1]
MLMSITNPRESLATVDKAADTLSEMILDPVASQLENKRLLIVSDGLLQYLPFATLSIPGTTAETDGYQPLLTKHQIVHSPSASTIANIRTETQNRQVANKTVAIIADPVFQPNDLRVQGEKVATTKALENVLSLQAQLINRGARDANITWQRLPGTRQEAQAIMKLVPESQRTEVFDFEANREMTLGQELGEYKFVHFATHGFINGQKPERSGLVMSLVDKNGNWQDGFLRLNDIYNLNLPVEMVVLSACQTARGKNIRGEGLVSLTRGFMYAGAKRVVASLWNVDDEATAELMSKFYRGMLDRGVSPVEALRQSQLETMKQQGWQHPYYWGAFTLQGEWE